MALDLRFLISVPPGEQDPFVGIAGEQGQWAPCLLLRDQVPSEALGEPPSPSCHPGTTEPGVMARAWAWCQPRGSQADRAEQGPDHRQKRREPGIKEKMGFEKLMSLKPEGLP